MAGQSWDFDLVTIGAGSGGVRASRMAALAGARAAVVEESALGGTCVNAGCIPKKLFVYASHFSDDFADAAGFGWTVGARSFDWARLLANKDREIERLNGVYARLLDDAGVTRLEGRATFVDAHTVEIDGRRHTAANVLVATGAAPVLPEVPGGEHALTSGQMFHLPALPARVVIIGGGYIAVEFACILHGLGVAVTLLHRNPLFLRGFDDDVRRTLAEEMRRRGVDLRFGVRVTRIERHGDERRVVLEDGTALATDAVLCAIGRRPLTAGLGLERAGVATGPAGAIVVDEYSRTSAPSVWAIGDVTDRIQLTPVAIHEAMALVRTLFGGVPTKPDHEDVATAVFSQPAVAAVGLTEAEARARYGDVVVYRSTFRPLKHTLTGRDERAMMKLVVDRASDRVLGAHMVGPDAAEIVQGLAIAVKMKATKAAFDATVGIHPTAAEEFVTMRGPV